MVERAQPAESYLSDIRVVELADEQAEYCGRLLAGLGADVIKVEPPGGSPTRRIGPFYADKPDPERSLYFWQYNLGKRSVVLDLERADDRDRFLDLVATADVLLESTPRGYLDRLGLGKDDLLGRFPSLLFARISPFGDTGPWVDYKASDLIHLALGGPMMNTGYDPEPGGFYDLPPIAPQMWHSYHIAGELLAINIMGALLHRRDTGRGQYLSCAVHDAVSKNTELDLQNWIMRRAPFYRQTCRHAGETISPRSIGPTKEGRWLMTTGPAGSSTRGWAELRRILDEHGVEHDLYEEPYASLPDNPELARDTAVRLHLIEVMHRLLQRYQLERVPWKEAQNAGLLWAPLRKPHENALDEHWLKRGSFGEVYHPELGRSFVYPVGKWVSSECAWRTGPRAPLLGEHTAEVLADGATGRRGDGGWAANDRPYAHPDPRPGGERITPSSVPKGDTRLSRRGKPFALHGVRILDFTWWLASGGAGRFLSALGAEDIKVEWSGHPDLRVNYAQAPIGGRAARERATAPLPPDNSTPNRSGQYNDIRAGHRSLSLNVRHPKGLAIARRLVAVCDIVAEGFSPGVMESWGLGYAEMRRIKPDIIYVQQSGFGAKGTYGRFRTVGPIAAAMAGISELSGLPEPAPPAGWGYSYLDWFGAYNLATAMMAALNYKERTGKGMWIDSSQVDCGLYISGTSVLDWSANGREWRRYGNRSPYKPAAPHGAYRCQGEDRWIAIACFTEDEWRALVEVAGHPEWARDRRFDTLEARLAHQDALDALVNAWTATQEDYPLMHALQRAGVPAGVCQNAEDRYERDPQLKALEWLVEVTGKEIGTWPVREVPVKMSETPPFMGGPWDRGAPCYGEDNEYVLGELLGLSTREIAALKEEGVIEDA